MNHKVNTPDDSKNRLKRSWFSAWVLLRSIRTRIILPYVILTILVAFAGTYIVTTLVQGSLEERLLSQLADAAGVANDEVALFETSLLSQLRELTFLQGAYEAMRDGDSQTVQQLLVPSISNSAIRRAIITDLNANVVLDIVLPPGSAEPKPDGSLGGRNILQVSLIQWALSGIGDQYGDRHAGLLQIDNELYLGIGGPFRLSSDPDDPDSELVGAVIVAEPLHTLLDRIKETAVVRRVTVYGPDGEVVATTLGEDEPRREELAITTAFFQAIVSDPSRTFQQERTVLGRRVRFAYFTFLIRHEAMGVMSIGIESGFVPETGAWGRFQLATIFSLATLAVIGIGYTVSRRIITPIMKILRTSRAVAQGDLTQRTGIQSNDELGALAVTFDDMTAKLDKRTSELERLLQEQREQASRVQAILESVAEGVLMEDQNNQIVTMNPAAQDLLEVLSEQFRASQPVREIEAASDVRRFEIGDRIISVDTSPVMMPDGTQLGKVLVLRDITRETEVDRLKDEFIAQISQELRTPLASIKGYSDLLLRVTGGEQHRPFLETIDTLEDMITNLLDFTQLEAGNLEFRFEPTSMETIVQEAIPALSERCEEKDIRFSVHIDGPIPQMLGDEARLRRALVNLVDNACNNTPEGGEAILSVHTDGHSITVSVQDTGEGITPEEQTRLFSRFHNIGLERTGDARGAGMDLYLAKAIVEAHRGSIWVESELGKGSILAFTIPLDAGVRDQEPPGGIFTDLGDLLR